MRIETVETLVVGGGVSGLAYAHARGAHADVLVCEAAGRAGGLVHTDEASIEGVRFERGPEALQIGSAALRALVDELALELVEAPPTARRRDFARGGRLHALPSGPLGFLRTPLLSARGKLRLLVEPWRDSRGGLSGSLADFARHRLGPEALAALVDPLVGGIHAGDPEQLSLRATFPELARAVLAHGSLFAALRARRGAERPGLARPRGGMQCLTDALAASLGPRLRTGCAVEALARDRDGWLASTPVGPIRAPRVVVALSAREAARLLDRAAPDVAEVAAEVESESLVGLVLAWPRARVAHALDGFGSLVPSREGLAHLGTLFSSSIDPAVCDADTVVLRVLAGGVRRPELVESDERELVERLLAEVRPLLGLRGKPRGHALVRWRGALPRYDLAHPRRLERLERALPAH
ncbi:MAG TPA: protoporphyrinogen oxidase, partial [Planctomycetota bacterium]|nr:protoporphyrinogen oxidase [Planctomycetota bacterium]